MSLKKILFTIGLIMSVHAQAEIAVPMAQLPYQNPQQLRTMIAQNDRLFSMDKTLRAFDKYVPPNYVLIVHGKDWPTYRGSCQSVYQNAEHCKEALRYLVRLMEHKEELGLTKMRVITFDDIPYRDPAPLEAAVQALDWTNGTPTMTHEQARELLTPYLDRSLVVDAPDGSQFNYSRANCLYTDFPWSAPYYVSCHGYASELLRIMRQRETAGARMMLNPFAR